jgi:hypothetical protein
VPPGHLKRADTLQLSRQASLSTLLKDLDHVVISEAEDGAQLEVVPQRKRDGEDDNVGGGGVEMLTQLIIFLLVRLSQVKVSPLIPPPQDADWLETFQALRAIDLPNPPQADAASSLIVRLIRDDLSRNDFAKLLSWTLLHLTTRNRWGEGGGGLILAQISLPWGAAR